MAKSHSKSSMTKRSPKHSKCPKRSPKHSKSPKRSPKRSKSPKGSKCPSKSVATCLPCKKQVKIVGCKMSKSKKGQPMVRGKCEKCGRGVSRFVKKN